MKEIVRLERITKVYPNGIIANDGLNLALNEGEIHAIAGENGAGKSTVMKILYGAEMPTSGEIFLDGKKVKISSPKVADSYGIGMVFQHFMLVNQFRVYENVFFGIEKRNRIGCLDRKWMITETKNLCQKYGMEIDPLAITGNLSVGMRQKVEILKVLARKARIIILDEPTAVLTPQETEVLFRQLRSLRGDGKTIVVITHRLKEIKELCDRVTILRNGKNCGVYDVNSISESEISKLMIGNSLSAPALKRPLSKGQTAISVQNLFVKGRGGKPAVDHVSFSASDGEILCLAGIEGNGQREIVKSLVGLGRRYEGEVSILGQNIKGFSVSSIRKLGISYVPEDRLKTGTDPLASIYDNIITPIVDKESFAGFLKRKKLMKRAEADIVSFGIKGTPKQKISMLSGGNMQKVIIARELGGTPKIVIAEQPTRGVDIGAMRFIHKKLLEMRDRGCCIILISADLSEVFALADRILVIHDGSIAAEIKDPSTTNEEQIGRYMLGIGEAEAAS